LFSWDSMFSHAAEASYHFNIRLFLYAIARLCQPCSPPSFVFYMAICYSKKAHIVVFLFISLLQRVVFHLISFFLFISTSSSLFLQTLTQHLCQPCSPHSFDFYMASCYLQKHILSSSSLFLFFNKSSSSLFPYFSSSAHHFPYFFKPLVFLFISSNPNAISLYQRCSPPSFVFYVAVCYSQKHILSSSSLFFFFNESSSSLFPYFSSSTYRLPYFFKP
jgi:hypothetical protein